MSKLETQRALPRRKLYRSKAEFIQHSGRQLAKEIEAPLKRKAKKAKGKR